MKKALPFLFGAAMLALTACGGNSQPAATTAAPTTAAPTTAAPAETKAPKTTKAPETTAEEVKAVSNAADEFVGCWRYVDTPYFLEIFDDNTFYMHHFDGHVEEKGSWEMGGDCTSLYLADGSHWTDLSYTAYGDLFDSDKEATLIQTSVPEPMEADEIDFGGVWRYSDYPLWICIYDNREYEFFDYKGESSGLMNYDFIDNGLVMYTETGYEDMTLYKVADDELMTNDMVYLVRSDLPDDFEAYEIDGKGGEEFGYFMAIDYFGAWKYFDYDMWLYVYDDGSYEWIYSNGDSDSGFWYTGGDCLYLANPWGGPDNSVYFDGDYLVDETGDRLYPDIPPFDRYLY